MVVVKNNLLSVGQITLNHSNSMSLMPCDGNLAKSLAWERVSNALLKTMNTLPTRFLLSTCFRLSSVKRVAASSVDVFWRNPNCCFCELILFVQMIEKPFAHYLPPPL